MVRVPKVFGPLTDSVTGAFIATHHEPILELKLPRLLSHAPGTTEQKQKRKKNHTTKTCVRTCVVDFGRLVGWFRFRVLVVAWSCVGEVPL